MGQKLTVRYDRVGDILYLEKVAPYSEQESNELGDEIFARFNPVTGEIETLEIMFFSTRFRENAVLELPVSAELRAAAP